MKLVLGAGSGRTNGRWEVDVRAALLQVIILRAGGVQVLQEQQSESERPSHVHVIGRTTEMNAEMGNTHLTRHAHGVPRSSISLL